MNNKRASLKTWSFLYRRLRRGRGFAFLILTCTLILTCITLILPHLPAAHASNPTLQVVPSSSSYPRQIRVTGTNYGSVEKVAVYWNYSGPGTGTLEKTATTDSTGTFSVLFYVPLTATGTYTIAGVGKSSGLIATAPFQLLPALTITPVAGIAGTSLTLTGKAFGNTETVNIYWNYSTKTHTGTLIAALPGDSTGSFTYTFNAPSGTTLKRVTIAGIGQTTQTTALTDFTVYPPTLALAPIQGSPGSTLTLSAYGFAANEQVNFYWNHTTTPIGSGSTDAIGYLNPATITVPSSASTGGYSITAVGQTSNITSSNTFTIVGTSSKFSITSGPVGVNVALTGRGYTPGESVQVLWNYTGSGTGTAIGQITAGVAGDINGSFIVPTATTGTYTVALVGTTSLDVSQNTFLLSSSLASSPASASPGTSVTISGTGFQPTEQVALYWETTSGQPLATASADANGNISQAIAFPSNAPSGVHSVIGSGLTSQTTLTTSVTVNTNWGGFGLDDPHDRNNTYENGLNSTTVANLKLKWSAYQSASLWSSPVYADGIVYQATSRGILHAYNATTGSLLWQYNTKTVDTEVSAPLVDPSTNTVFYGTITQLISSASDVGLPSPVYGLDAKTGTLKWSIIIPADEYGFPTLAFNTVYVGAARELGPGYVLAIDMVSGNIRWKYFTHSTWGSMAVDTDKGIVFTGNANPNAQILALDAQNGQLIWQLNIPNSPNDTDVGSGLVVKNGLVYANSKNGNVYAVNESNGTVAWSTTVALHYDFSDVSSPALSSSGVIYVGSTDSNLYALNATTGAVIWKVSVGAGISSSPALANGVVYFASTNDTIYALDATNGSTLWSYTTGALSYSSPVVVNGWLYCGSSDGKLYAFSL